ncbi:BT_2262 family domain-containing protein [Parapedobacter indicus]|uniref:Pesticidal crystal protein Cry22Aa Ig-like domain-containing protein n=1 Tax=Parapedobacter indicus TaxID=1477437 RepID=A0A1I3DFH4_9SPHI|nr:BT_2262 family domain-containing protein [Parapedobacter indicus]PPL04655.1 uncharacterized protein DUF5011 [Parapedobacter indicus]SFH85540.1 protein of unknown function [Parapedobacter indicus]
MKSKVIIFAALVLAGIGFQSCEKETTAGFTDITIYPVLEVLGDPIVVVNKGESYEDAGTHAELDGEDVTGDVVVRSDVNTDEVGIYSVNYSITNADGFTVTGARTVYVTDPTPSVITPGLKTVSVGTNRSGGGAVTAYSGYPVVILQTEPGIFYITDYFGGYYEVRAGYGPAYAMKGSFKLNADNTLSLIESGVDGWGDSLDDLSSASVDPGTGAIRFTASYAGTYNFNVILN